MSEELVKRENESMTEFAIRRLRFKFLSDMQKRIAAWSEPELERMLDAVGESHKVGFRSAYRDATNKICGLIEDAKFE